MSLLERLRRWLRQTAQPVLLDLAIGSVGGIAAHFLNLPLAWMIGAMVATTAAAVIGVKLAFSRPLRTGMITVLGVMLGSAFVPELLDQMARWSFSLAALAIYTVATTAATMAYFRCVAANAADRRALRTRPPIPTPTDLGPTSWTRTRARWWSIRAPSGSAKAVLRIRVQAPC